MPSRVGTRKAALQGRTNPATLAPPRGATLPRVAFAPGDVHVENLTLPPSDLWSPEFRAFYAASMPAENTLRTEWPAPLRTAPKAEWDRFDDWLEANHTRPLLAAVLRRYPVDVTETSIAGVPVGIVLPRSGVSPSNKDRVLINLRGGGFVVHRGLLAGQTESAPVAATGSIKVITIDYRQAPFHYFPAASDDVEAVYVELLKEYSPSGIGIFGCSAGAVLTAQVLARLQDRGLPRPGAAGLFSMAPPPPFSLFAPWDTTWGDTGLWHAGVPCAEPSANDRLMYQMVQWYMKDCDSKDPLAYPGSFDHVLGNFPAVLLLSGTRDFAASTLIATHARLLKLGVRSSLYLMEGAPHAAHVTAVDTPEAQDAQSYIARWFQQQLSA